MQTYRQTTEPLAKFYAQRRVLAAIKDAPTIEEVSSQIRRITASLIQKAKL